MSDTVIPFPQKPVAKGDILPPELKGAQWVEPFDVTATFNMRGWLQKAVEAQGAKMVGGSTGPDGADIDIELDGCRFNITIRALLRVGEPVPDSTDDASNPNVFA